MNKAKYIKFKVDGRTVKWDLSRPILTPGYGNVKLNKSEKASVGYSTMGLHLAPEKVSGYNVCPKASEGCKKICLNYSGQGQMFYVGKMYESHVHKARIAKTILFMENKKLFFKKLIHEIELFIGRCNCKGTISAMRLNCTSDIAWEKIKDPTSKKTLMELFPNVQFYDYTKIISRLNKTPKNYFLNFSRTENNDQEVEKALNMGINVCAVFEKDFPNNYKGYRIINGDLTDLRFLDNKFFKNKSGLGVIVGLKGKGCRIKRDKTGFVIRPHMWNEIVFNQNISTKRNNENYF